MLVLTRRTGEEIIVNNNIRVTVVSVKGDRVRIGVEAPHDVPVDRAEVHNRRNQFTTVEVPVAALVGHDDGAVMLGDMPRTGDEDTMKH